MYICVYSISESLASHVYTPTHTYIYTGQSIYTRLAGGFLTVLGLTGALVIRKWEKLFIFQDWDHSKNH